MGKKSSSTPPAPDYAALAAQQAKSSKEVTRDQTYANRPNQVTPWGNVSWTPTETVDPSTGKKVTSWTQNTTLTPELQAALDSQISLQRGRSDLGNSLMGQVSDQLSKPFDWGSMPERGQNVGLSNFQTYSGGPSLQSYQGNSPQLNTYVATENAQRVAGRPDLQSGVNTQRVQNRVNLNDNGQLQATDDLARQRIEQGLFDRMSPIHERQSTALEVKLANQGITPGSAAYKRAVQDLNDQQSRERYDAMQTAGQEMQRNQQMALGNRQQMTNEDLATAGLFNSANQQKFGQDLAAAQFGNTALKDMYGMDLSNVNTNNAAIQQDFGQRLAAGNFENAAKSTQQALDLARLGFNNDAAYKQQGLDLAALQFNNQVGQQQFNQAMQQSQYQNQLRNSAIAEEMQRRGMGLNEINALLSGQQVNMPQMPGFNSAGAAQPVQSLAAGGMQYQAALDAANMQNMGNNSMMSGLGSLFGSALGAYASNPSAFSFSDKRLKKILGKVGKVGEFNLYRFKYIWSDKEEVGVIAQEVKKLRPDLVKEHASGYLMVNYAGLEA